MLNNFRFVFTVEMTELWSAATPQQHPSHHILGLSSNIQKSRIEEEKNDDEHEEMWRS